MESKSLKSNMLWNSVGSLYYSTCQWLITVLVARLSSGFDAAGILSIAMSVSNIFSQIGLYRIRSYQVSDIHEEYSSREYVGFRLETIAVGFLITIVYALISCSLEMLVPILLYLLFRAGDTFVDVLHGVDQQHFRMDYCGKSMLIRGTLFLVSFTIGLAFFNSLNVAISGMVLSTYLAIIYDITKTRGLSDIRPSITLEKSKRLLLTCLPAVIGMSLCSVVVTYARQYLGEACGSSALGIYATVCTPIVIIQACANYVYAPLLGIFAESYDTGRTSDFISLLMKTLFALVVIFAVCAVGFVMVGDQLLGFIFGPTIAANGNLIYAGLLCSMLTALVAFLSDLLISLRDMNGCFIGNLIGCLVSFPATHILVSQFGMNGTSYSISISYIVVSIILLFRLVRLVKPKAIA